MAEENTPAKELTPIGYTRVLGIVNGGGNFIDMTEAQKAGMEVLSRHITGKKQAELRFDKTKSVGVYGHIDGQAQQELNEGDDRRAFGDDTIDTPYNFDVLDDLMYRNVTHNACVETKAGDYAYHGWELMQRPDIEGVNEKEIEAARVEAETFLRTCVDGLLPIEDLIRDLALDYESIGSCGFELVRNTKGRVARLNHIPAHSVRVHRNALLGSPAQHYVQCRFNKKRYFMPFGGTVDIRNGFDPLTALPEEFPSLKDRDSFLKLKSSFYKRDKINERTRDIRLAATEMYWLARPPKSRSTVYGTPAGAAAYGNMLGELRSDYYNLAYFNSKGVPQFAVIMENPNPVYATGATPRQDGDPDPTAMAANAVQEFFAKKLATSDRNVLVLEGVGGTKIRFERLSPETIDKTMIEYSDACRESIRLAHRVPPAALGIIKASNLGNGRDSSQMLRYRNHIVTPGQRVFSAVVNSILRVGLLIPYFNFSFHLMPVDDEQERREFKLKEFEIGAITPNEYRKETKRELFTDQEGKSDIGDSLIVRNAQIMIASPDGKVITTAPGDAAGEGSGSGTDIGKPVNPASPADVGQ